MCKSAKIEPRVSLFALVLKPSQLYNTLTLPCPPKLYDPLMVVYFGGVSHRNER